MSRRNALLAAIAAAIVVAAFFFWPEPARADMGVSARIGGGFGGHDIGSRLHRGGGGGGGGGFRGKVHFGHGGVHGRVRLGDDFGRHGSFRHDRGHRKHGVLLGDRFRDFQHRRIIGSRHAKGSLLGDRFRFKQQRRLKSEFGGRDRWREGHGRDWHDRKWHGHEGRGHKWDGHGRHGRGRHVGKFPFAGPVLLPYGGTDVVVREIIVPVPVPAPPQPEAAPEPAVLDPHGRATLMGDGEGTAGDWAPGDVLPGDLPHVALDPDAYGLPQPPAGEKYARVGNDVLRIEADSRRVTEVVAR